MAQPKILVTGATGKTGSAIVESLLAKGYPVRAAVHAEDARSARLQALGAEISVTDLYDPQQLYQALKGVARVFYLPIMRPHMIQAASAFMVAAAEAKPEMIVQMSQWTANARHPTPMTQQTWLVDRMFSMIPGVAHTIFNPGMFADNFLRVIDFAAQLGIFPVLMGDSQSAPISNEDMGKAAAAILADGPAKHAGKRYRPTGPALLSGTDIAAILSRVLGHRVRPVPLPLFMFYKVARMQRIDPYAIYLLSHYIEDSKQGAFSFEGGVTDVMRELTGAPAENFETTARRYAALPFAQRNFGSRARAMLRFMLTPFVTGYDIARYAKTLELPALTPTEYCMENQEWRQSRQGQMRAQTLRDSALSLVTTNVPLAPTLHVPTSQTA